MYSLTIRHRGKPAGEEFSLAGSRGQFAVGLARRVAQDGVVLQLAAVRLEDQITEGKLALRAVIVVIEEEPELAQAAL